MSRNDEHRGSQNGRREDGDGPLDGRDGIREPGDGRKVNRDGETLEERQTGYLLYKQLSDIEVPGDLVGNVRERVSRHQARRAKFRRWWPVVAVPLVAAALTAIIMAVTGRSLEAPDPGRSKDPYKHHARKGKGKRALKKTLDVPKGGLPEDPGNEAARKKGKLRNKIMEKGLKDALKMLQAPGKVGDGGRSRPGDGGPDRDRRRRSFK